MTIGHTAKVGRQQRLNGDGGTNGGMPIGYTTQVLQYPSGRTAVGGITIGHTALVLRQKRQNGERTVKGGDTIGYTAQVLRPFARIRAAGG